MSIASLLVVLSVCASTVYAKAVPEPMVTPAAVLPRQNDDQRFIGFYSTTGELTWDTARCAASSSWTASGSYGRCCSSGLTCDFATRCSNNYALVPGTSVSCSYTCNTDYLYTSTGGSVSTKWIGCAFGSVSTSFFQNLPATGVLNTFGGSSPSSPTGSGLVRPTVTVSPIVPTTTPVPITRTKKKSLAWIAGVVVGVVVLFAIIGIVACVLIRRKKKKASAAALAAGQANTFNGAPPANYQQPMQQQYPQAPQQTMGAMGQPQYGAPPPEGGYYATDPKNNLYPQANSQSPPPPVWTPSQQQSPYQPPPVSPDNRHLSLAPSEVSQQHADSINPPSELGSSAPNNLGSNPSLAPQSPTGTHLTGISEVNSSPTYPPPVAKVPMQAHNNQGPISEMQ